MSVETKFTEIEVYVRSNGRAPFNDWLNSLKDIKARAIIRVRIDRILEKPGNIGRIIGTKNEKKK